MAEKTCDCKFVEIGRGASSLGPMRFTTVRSANSGDISNSTNSRPPKSTALIRSLLPGPNRGLDSSRRPFGVESVVLAGDSSPLLPSFRPNADFIKASSASTFPSPAPRFEMGGSETGVCRCIRARLDKTTALPLTDSGYAFSLSAGRKELILAFRLHHSVDRKDLILASSDALRKDLILARTGLSDLPRSQEPTSCWDIEEPDVPREDSQEALPEAPEGAPEAGAAGAAPLAPAFLSAAGSRDRCRLPPF